MVSQQQTKNVSIQINPLNTQLKTYVSINNLITALQNDLDLSSLPIENIPKIMVSLFVSTGSDYTSYFKSIGKASFLNCFFHHSSFITGRETEGSLGDFEQNSRDLGFLAFLRLVETAYFKNIYHHSFLFMSQKHHNNCTILLTHLYKRKKDTNYG